MPPDAFRFLPIPSQVRSSYKAGELFLAAMMDEDSAEADAERARLGLAVEVSERHAAAPRAEPSWNPELRVHSVS